jgi:hypothetical protein
MTLTAFDTNATRRAIAMGDDAALERYLREGPANGGVYNITASSIGMSQAQHAGKVLTLNIAGGTTLTLPYATGTQDKYTIVVGTTFTGDGIIKVGRAADTFIGFSNGATLAGTTGFAEGVGGTDDTLTMNGTTTGGIVGSSVEFTDIATNLWLVDARLVGSSTMVTSFTATV